MSPALTYLFYDLETSGRNPAFDQILQFAAVRTDADFHELERHEFRIRLRSDVVPSPGALLVTGLNPFDCLTDGLTEYEAVCRMHELVNRPGTISVGYNSLTFDDLFLRFAFYRNLLPPYDHQFRNGCRRIDMFPITILYWLQESGVVEWPLVDGAPSLKLEHMNAANGLADGAAHDAMVDVLATLALARRLRGDGVVWAECQELFAEGKDAHSRRLESLPQGFALLIGTNFGYDRKFQVPVLRLGHQNGRHIWLQLDRPELQQINLHNITETAWISRTRAGEPPFVFPPKPHQLSEDRQQLLKENVNWLREHADILEESAAMPRRCPSPMQRRRTWMRRCMPTGSPMRRRKRCAGGFTSWIWPGKLGWYPNFLIR